MFFFLFSCPSLGVDMWFKKVLIALLLTLAFHSVLTSQNDVQYRFRQISPESGFFHNGIQAIAQDGSGFIWFISINELYRFDGYNFTRKSNIVYGAEELKNPRFFDIYNDSENRLWISTNKGLFIYKPESAQFRIVLQPAEPVNQIMEDRHGNMWVLKAGKPFLVNVGAGQLVAVSNGIENDPCISAMFSDKRNTWFANCNGGIYFYNSNFGRFQLFADIGQGADIRAVEANSNSVFVLTLNDGLFRFSTNGEFLKKYSFFLDNEQMKGNNIAKALYSDSYDNLWIGTHRGIYILNTETDEYNHFTSRSNTEYSLPNNSVWTINEDANGGVWIGTYSGGIGYLSFNDHHFVHVRQNTNSSMNNNSVSTFAEDPNGNFWIGTEGAGLNYYNRHTKSFKHYIHSAGENSLSYDNVKSLVTDKNNNLWIGMYEGGLDMLDVEEGRFFNFKYDPEDKASLVDNSVYALEAEADSGLWVATSSGAIDYFSFRDQKFYHVVPKADVQDAAGSHFINGMCRGINNNLWVASKHGLGLLNIATKEYTNYFFNPGDTDDFGSNELFCVLEESDSRIWLGTRGYGLFSFNPITKTFTAHPGHDGLVATAIYSILQDGRGNLWLSTNNGLFKYDQQDNSYRRFDSSDGLQGNLFFPNSALKCRNGQLVFGGTNGFTLFDPQLVNTNSVKPKVVITGLTANNKRIENFTDKKGNSKYINYTKKIELNHKQSVFSFEFSAINYLMPEKNKFAFQLEGYDDDWVYTTADKRFASYSNLSPGLYTFKLKAANNDGLWNDEIKSVELEILPSPWRTWWATTIYLLLFTALVVAGLRVYIVRKKFRTQLQLERLSKEKMTELNRIKIQFFTNISHEFKTPLTLISSPLKKVIQKTKKDEELHNDLSLIQRNLVRLQNLINELMDFRAIENKKIHINCKNADLVRFFREMLNLFYPLIEEHQIQFNFKTEQEKLMAAFDPHIYEKIFYNLFSNAVKYTPSGGKIEVKLLRQRISETEQLGEEKIAGEKALLFQISNSGKPIPEDQLPFIFDNYYYIDKQDNIRIQTGSGLGLAFTKELVELLNGEINVVSRKSETIFRVAIPLNDTIKVAENAKDETVISHSFRYSQKLVPLLESEKKEKVYSNGSKKLKTILVVEDNLDLKQHLFDLFHAEYNVLIGSNGKEGLNLAQKKKPVVVVSDVMMPEMKGTEMCRKLKSDIETSHIPIIMLSAFNSQEQKFEGMESGADVYVEKPFDPDYLKLQVNNIIQSREAIRANFSKKITAEPSEVPVSATDENFVKKAVQIIEANMDNSSFNVEYFVSEMGMGRTVLYQKIKALTDLSVNEFIQNIRLKRAAQLLKDSDLSISETAYSVGFNDPKYFSTCFKKNFNQSPTEFIAQKRHA